MTELRVLTWNLQKMYGDPLAIHRVIRGADPDVALFQETSRYPWSRLLLSALARSTGLRVAGGGWRGAGTSVLVSPRVELVGTKAFRLPTPGRFATPRGATVARVRKDGDPEVTAACLHLDLDRARRTEHLELLRRRLSGTPRLVVAGDFNEPPDGVTWQTLQTFVRDPEPGGERTFSVKKPRRRLDGVLVSGDLTVSEYDVWRADLRDLVISSDHRPVLAVIQSRNPTGS